MAKLQFLAFYSWSLLLIVGVTLIWTKPLIDSFYGSSRDFKVEHSLEKPFFTEGNELSHGRWTFNGSRSLDESLHDNFIRLAGGHPNEFGFIWNSVPVAMKNWEVDVEFRIHGNSNMSGYGDGLIFLCSQNKIHLGPIFGSMSVISESSFSGFAVVVESADPKSTALDSIYALVKKGALEYGDDTQTKFPGCSTELRNSQTISKLRIQIEHNILSVWFAKEKEGSEKLDWHPCLKVGVDLSTENQNGQYYLGLSANTGPISIDNHDIWAVKTYELHEYQEDEEEDDAHERDLSYYERPSRPGFGLPHGEGQESSSTNYIILPLLVFLAFIAFGVFGLSISEREELDT